MKQVVKIASALTIFSLVVPLVLPLLSFAQEIPIPVEPDQATEQRICDVNDTTRVCLAKIFTIVFRILILVAGALAVILFIYAGILYILGGAKEDTQKKVKSMLIYGAVGLVVALIAYAVVKLLQNFVNIGGIT